MLHGALQLRQKRKKHSQMGQFCGLSWPPPSLRPRGHQNGGGNAVGKGRCPLCSCFREVFSMVCVRRFGNVLQGMVVLRGEVNPAQFTTRSGPGGLPVGGREPVGFGLLHFWQLGAERSRARLSEGGWKGWVEPQPGWGFQGRFLIKSATTQQTCVLLSTGGDKPILRSSGQRKSSAAAPGEQQEQGWMLLGRTGGDWWPQEKGDCSVPTPSPGWDQAGG